jgi:hypothetical protein
MLESTQGTTCDNGSVYKLDTNTNAKSTGCCCREISFDPLGGGGGGNLDNAMDIASEMAVCNLGFVDVPVANTCGNSSGAAETSSSVVVVVDADVDIADTIS